MRSLRNRLRQAVLAVPVATAACFSAPAGIQVGSTSSGTGTSGSGGASTSGSSGAGSSGSCQLLVTNNPTGCASCNPLTEVCSAAETLGTCRPTCNTCGGCFQTEADAPAPPGALPGVTMAPGFFAANPCYPLCVNGPDAGSAQLTDCHIEAAPDGSAIPAPGGTVKVSCTWNAPSERCPPDSTACVACNPESELCDPTTGICSSLCGCGGCWTSSVTVSADLPTDDAGTILPTTCSDLCPIPDAGPSTPTGVPECHPEYGPTGQPVVCDGQVVLACVWSQGCVGGRRPEGFVPRVGERGLGAYWAQAATLETASIPAFRRLERELAHHGAPVELQRRARRAARDEIRHARAMTALARQHGAHPDRVEWVDGGLRSLVQIAQENAVEGCVRETFGAALAMWQAEHAADGTVRRTMATIAEDEADHAELAWDVAIWIEARLTDAERRAVQDERLQAQRELELSLDAETDEALTAGAGLPPRAQAGALFRAIQREL